MKEQRTGPIIAAVVAALLLLFVGYMGSYYALLDPGEIDVGGVTEGLLPVYRVDSIVVKVIFWPANQIDRRLIRPEQWEFDDWG